MTRSRRRACARTFDNAPCGYVIAAPGRKHPGVNATIASWLGRERRRADRHAVHRPADRRWPHPLRNPLRADAAAPGPAQRRRRRHRRLRRPPTARPPHRQRQVRRRRPTPAGAHRRHDAADRRSYERELLDERQRAEEERGRAGACADTSTLALAAVAVTATGSGGGRALPRPSADDVGGDFYDLFPLPHEKYGFFLGDVCGKGVGAAALTSLTRYTLRAAAVFDDDPVAVLHNLHTVLSQEFRDTVNLFATVIFGILTPGDGGFDMRARQRRASSPDHAGRRGRGTVRRHRRRPARRDPMEPKFVGARIDWGRATRWFSTPTA